MQIYVRVGRGFVPFSTNAELISSNGIIATDSNYSPILQVG
jgi:DNA-directed RNA polymerase subunit alpha